MQKFEETESTRVRVSPVHHRVVCSAENISTVSDNVAEYPELSIDSSSFA